MEFVDETKCYIQFDQFGVESSFYQLNPLTDILSDAQSIRFITLLKQEKELHRVLMSHDIHTKHRLVSIFQRFHIQFYVMNMNMITHTILLSFQRIIFNFIILFKTLLVLFHL